MMNMIIYTKRFRDTGKRNFEEILIKWLLFLLKQSPTTFNFGLASTFFFVFRTLSMRQKTKNHQNQGSIEKKIDFFPVP
jgi:hypothetical protein